MKRLLTSATIIFIFLLGSITANAQRTDSISSANWFHRDVTGALQFQLTYRNTEIGQLNNALNANGLRSISASNVWLNASMSHRHENWITEDGIGFTPTTTSENNGLDAKYNQYQAYLRVGYNLSNSTDFALYPFLGVNFSAAVLDIQDHNRVQSTDNFTDEILNSTSSKTFYQPNFGIEIGAGFDYQIKVKPKRMECLTIERTIPIGVRVGYYYNAYAGDWKIDSYTLHDGPTEKQNAVFVSFNIGLGYELKKD